MISNPWNGNYTPKPRLRQARMSFPSRPRPRPRPFWGGFAGKFKGEPDTLVEGKTKKGHRFYPTDAEAAKAGAQAVPMTTTQATDPIDPPLYEGGEWDFGDTIPAGTQLFVAPKEYDEPAIAVLGEEDAAPPQGWAWVPIPDDLTAPHKQFPQPVANVWIARAALEGIPAKTNGGPSLDTGKDKDGTPMKPMQGGVAVAAVAVIAAWFFFFRKKGA